MAVFLLKAESARPTSRPPCTGAFADVPCGFALRAAWIEELFAGNITGGCGGGNYCPLHRTPRGQIAMLSSKRFRFNKGAVMRESGPSPSMRGETTALDDILESWYGIGSLGETANGMLEILPLNNPAVTTLTTVASSRTYNVTVEGTLGQFIPAFPFWRVHRQSLGGRAAGRSQPAADLPVRRLPHQRRRGRRIGPGRLGDHELFNSAG